MPCHGADADALAEGPIFFSRIHAPSPCWVVSHKDDYHIDTCICPSRAATLLLLLETMRWAWLKEDGINELSLFLASITAGMVEFRG